MNHLRLDVGDLPTSERTTFERRRNPAAELPSSRKLETRNGPRKDGHSLRDEHACAFARAAAAADDRPLVPQVAAAGVAGA